MPGPQKRLATLRHPSIEAVADGLFRFAGEQQAIERMEAIRSRFIAAREQEEEVWPPTLIFWIRGYAITKEEEEKGYQGNFARMRCEMRGDKYTLVLDKLDIPLAKHPQKKRARQ